MTAGQTNRIDCAESSVSSVCVSLCLGCFECICLSSRCIVQSVSFGECLSGVFSLEIKCKIHCMLVTLQSCRENLSGNVS